MSAEATPAPLACPACRAAFRGARVCPRCGADLGDVMAVVVRAWRLRREGWQMLEAGALTRAAALAGESLALHATPSARRLGFVVATMVPR